MSRAIAPDPALRDGAARLLLLALCLVLAACAPSRQQIRSAQAEVAVVQPTRVDCVAVDRCAIDSPLRERAVDAVARSAVDGPLHRLLLLESGQDALLAQIHLIRAAQSSIDVQSFIFAEDDAGQFVLAELLAAARRGIRVRLLVDQLFSVDDVELLARLSQAHANFSMRMYNPTFGQAHTNKFEFAAGVLCCFVRFNHRMHNKLLLVDGIVGITGGRNYQNRYFDWDSEFNYRDRDVLVAGPVADDMGRSFDQFWRHRLSVPIAALRDVRQARRALDADIRPVLRTPPTEPARVRLMSARAGDAGIVTERLVEPLIEAEAVEYLSDAPNKPLQRRRAEGDDVSRRLRKLLGSAEQSVLLQTPYLVLSPAAREQFLALRRRPDPPRVQVSTNSLAATDAFPVYALSHKYKRRYLRQYGFEIHEYKPFPESPPNDLGFARGDGDPDALGAWATEARRTSMGSAYRRYGPLPLRQAGIRIGLHAKALVIDRTIGIIGTHNFDPRSDRLNTESVVVVRGRQFAERLATVIEHDMRPENAWTIAPRPKPPVLSGLNYSLGKVSEYLPLFDVWPWRYSTSWEIRPGCSPLPYRDPGFADCYEPVGDFPEVRLSTKSIYTRILTAFGAGLQPIL